jgi:hypothetical protein
LTIGYTPDLSKDTLYRGKLTDPDVIIDSNMFLSGAKVEMKYRLRGVDIYYTLDGREPDSTSTLYKHPVTVTNAGTLKVKAMRTGWQSSKTLSFPFEKAAYKFTDAKLEVQPDKRYPAKRDSSLIDFKRGAVDGADENYLGFESNDMTAWLNLGDAKMLSNVSVSYLVNHGSFILAPSGLELWSATADGKKLKRLGTVSYSEKGLQKEARRNVLNVKFPRQPVQYLVLTVHNIGKTPSWHPSKGSKSWMFIDEVMAQ